MAWLVQYTNETASQTGWTCGAFSTIGIARYIYHSHGVSSVIHHTRYRREKQGNAVICKAWIYFSSSRASNQRSYSTVVAADQMNDLFAASDPFFSSEADWNAANGDEAPLHREFGYWTRKTRTKKRTYEAVVLAANGRRVASAVQSTDAGNGVAGEATNNRDEKEVLKNRWMDIHEAGHVLDVNSQKTQETSDRVGRGLT